MDGEGPVLVGISGIVRGENFPLEEGKATVIGRSRSCDISLRDCKRWVEAEDAGELIEETSKTVSRKHLKISIHDPTSIELEDLSSNGTFVDGKRIDRLVITDAKETPHEIQLGILKRLRGTPQRPRLSVARSHKHISVQIVDDLTGSTLVAASTLEKKLTGKLQYGGNKDAAQVVGKAIAERAAAAGISAVCFDRGPYKYHGRVAALAVAAREGGLNF